MMDDKWEEQRKRAILTAFQTGRPVFADNEGELRYVDGKGEPVPVEVGVPKQPIPRAMTLTRAHRASRWAFVLSSVAGVANVIASFWDHPWQLGIAAVCGFSAFGWYRVGRRQLATLRDMSALDRGAEK